MSEDDAPVDFDSLLEDLELAAQDADGLTAAEILDIIGARGFGPVLVLLSCVLILPIGAIPGMPGVVAVLMALIGVMLILGRKRLHLPGRIARLHLGSDRIMAVTRRLRPAALRLRRLLHPRLQFLAASRPALVAIGVVLIGTGLVIFAIGFIPFLPFVLALHVLLLGLGLTMRDGFAVLAALALVVPEVMLVLRIL